MSFVEAGGQAFTRGFPVEHNGKTYYCQFVVQRVKAEFEQYLRQRALRHIAEMQAAGLSAELVQQELRQHQERVQQQGYGLEAWLRSVQEQLQAGHTERFDVEGFAALVRILFACSEEEAWELVLQRLPAVQAALDASFEASFGRAAKKAPRGAAARRQTRPLP